MFVNVVILYETHFALVLVQLVALSPIVFSWSFSVAVTEANSHKDLAIVLRPDALADATADHWATVAHVWSSGQPWRNPVQQIRALAQEPWMRQRRAGASPFPFKFSCSDQRISKFLHYHSPLGSQIWLMGEKMLPIRAVGWIKMSEKYFWFAV